VLGARAAFGDAPRRVKAPLDARPAALPRATVRALRTALLAWYARERRDLPWRRTRDPYAVWISEAMLQQTRVETVVPYYERFLARLPDVAALARADEDEVLGLWSGLGYYSRARALRAAACAIVARHGGELPRTQAEWLALPGVGPYTAGAVLSIAFSVSAALVDGNVQRVFARLFALQERLGSRALTEQSWALARALVPAPGEEHDPGQWNQALMELGARVCTPRAPACAVCPVRAHCKAQALGRAAELPLPKERRAPLAVELELAGVQRAGHWLLVRRPARGRMAGLLELPTRERSVGDETRLWPALFPAELALEDEVLARLAHTITHHRIRATLRRAVLVGPPPEASLWVTPAQCATLSLTGLTRKALAAHGGA